MKKFWGYVWAFLSGVLGALAAYFAFRKPPPDARDIEDKLREKDASDIISSLSNAGRVSAIISHYGPDSDNSPTGDAELRDSGLWGRSDIFHTGRVAASVTTTLGGKGKDG